MSKLEYTWRNTTTVDNLRALSGEKSKRIEDDDQCEHFDMMMQQIYETAIKAATDKLTQCNCAWLCEENVANRQIKELLKACKKCFVGCKIIAYQIDCIIIS